MLKSLEIENIAIIEKVSIDFDKGFNVLTGETGAGKSIIIDAINAALGLRTSKELVRTGASHALVIAAFVDVPPAVTDYLYKLDIDLGPDELILQRRIGADGKSACRINGKPVTAGVMKALGELLINVHGQHDSQKLLDSERHYLYLDKMLDDDTFLEEYRRSYAQLVKTVKELKALQTDENEKQRLRERLRYEIDEIERAQIQIGEKAALQRRKQQLQSLAAYQALLNDAKLVVSGDDETAGAAALAQGLLARFQNEPEEEFAPIKAQLQQACEALSATGEAIREKIEALNISPDAIDEVEERLGVYYAFSNRYGNTEEEILAYLQSAREKLDAIENTDQRIAQLEQAFAAQKEQTYQKALALSEKRRKTAEAFEKRVESELSFLNMPSARFQIDFQTGPISKTGIDIVTFLISVNQGESLKPLAAVASGGELSRIMLAFRAVLGEKEAVPTLIFDEIDTGVSGRAAGKVALKLKEVSQTAQVICVTHLAQIAAPANHHFLIRKSEADGRTYTNVLPLDFDGRKYELARIMGGMNINDLMLQNAQELLLAANENT